MNNFVIKMRLFFTLAIVFLLVSAKAGKITLKYDLTIGNTYKISVVTDQSVEINMMGQQQTMKNLMEGITAFKVQGIEKNTIILDTWFEKLKMSMETPMGTMVMDSDTTNNANPGSKVFNKLMNKHFTVKMATNGEIMEVEGAEKVMEDALKEASGIEEMQLSMLKESVKQFAGKEALKGNLGVSVYCFPDKPVKVGDTWTNQVDLESTMKAKIDNTWQLTDSKDGVSFLECKGKLKSKDDGSSQNMNGIPIKYNMTGEQQTVSKIDEKTGWIIESTMNQEISGEMIADLSSQGGGNQKFSLKITGKTIAKGIK